MKKEGYKVQSSTFKGTVKHNGEVTGYVYEITFNKSLRHTGRFEGIEKGLDQYVKKEQRENVIDSAKQLYYSLINWILNK